jgi:oligosaccharide translocation protein RFT1
VEEMSRVFFSKTLAGISSVSARSNISTVDGTDEDKDKNTSNRTILLDKASAVLSTIISVQIGASLVLCGFGPPLLPVVLQLVLPRRYLATSAPDLLQAWIWYIPILAINGVLEAFVSSVATPADVHRQSRWRPTTGSMNEC